MEMLSTTKKSYEGILGKISVYYLSPFDRPVKVVYSGSRLRSIGIDNAPVQNHGSLIGLWLHRTGKVLGQPCFDWTICLFNCC